jgi:hypothetical protein
MANGRRAIIITAVLTASSVCGVGVWAQPIPDYGFEWATITHPGNRLPNETEAPYLLGAPPRGSVAYEYRIMTREIAVEEWFEFVQAYAPYYDGPRTSDFTSFWILPSSLDPEEPPGYYIAAGAQRYAADFSWRFAARYANWLHNGKALEQWAFESGAYDTSTFTRNPDGSFNDQLAHSPGARFWIPTLDEWIKSVYFDPNRYGPGIEGYWMHPAQTDIPLLPGPPGVGQTSGGINDPNNYFFDVGSYPAVQSPWGLLDASGGVSEWTESTNSIPREWRYVRGSNAGTAVYDLADRLDEYWLFYQGFPLFGGSTGMRLASAVPTPSAACACLVLVVAWSNGRRRTSS